MKLWPSVRAFRRLRKHLRPVAGTSTSGLLAPESPGACGRHRGRMRNRPAAQPTSAPFRRGLLAGSLVFLVAAEVIWLRYFLPSASEQPRCSAWSWRGFARDRRRGVSPVERTTGLAYLLRRARQRRPLRVAPPMHSQARTTGHSPPRPTMRLPEPPRSARRERSTAEPDERWSSATTPARGTTSIGSRAGGVAVATFDIRTLHPHYVSRLQLDGRSGAAITGTTALAVARTEGEGDRSRLRPLLVLGARSRARSACGSISRHSGRIPPLRALRVYLPMSTQPNRQCRMSSRAPRRNERVSRA